MRSIVNIALIGDYNAAVLAHKAIPVALEMAARTLQIDVRPEWIGTDHIRNEQSVSGFHGVWCVPASPYRNEDGALLAIRHARTNGIPFLGTCGGFQHAILEYARNVVGWSNADHAETTPDSERCVIAPLSCSLVEQTDGVRLEPGSRIERAYGTSTAREGYHCRYGLNPTFEASLLSHSLRATAHDENGEVRAVELTDHPFFVATLFQPERVALTGQTPPLVVAFVQACTR